jgi:hypothetical protein
MLADFIADAQAADQRRDDNRHDPSDRANERQAPRGRLTQPLCDGQGPLATAD